MIFILLQLLGLAYNDFVTLDINLDDNPYEVLKDIKDKHSDRPVIAHLNINFLSPKFEQLSYLIKDKIDILLISETKLDSSFPKSNFEIEGFKDPYRLDRNCYGGGVMVFIRNDMPSKEIGTSLPGNIEGIFFEIIIGKSKWLIFGGYNPHKDKAKDFLKHVSKEVDGLLSKYENLLFLGDFNVEMEENVLMDFCDLYNLKNLINEPTCFKNPHNPSSIDVMLTNRHRNFENSITVETGLSDHHKLTLSVLKRYFKKREPITLYFRDFKNFDAINFREEIRTGLNSCEDYSLDTFNTFFKTVTNKHAPMKKKIVRGNNAPFMNKSLSQNFMHRAKLKNKLNKNPSEDNKKSYKKHRNFCTNLLRREKKKYFSNLDVKVVEDNKKFWKKIKPMLSDKIPSKKKMTLIDDEKVISGEKEIAEILNNYFVDAVENLEREPFPLLDNSTNLSDEIDRIIKKYHMHPSIVMIKSKVKVEKRFSFHAATVDEIYSHIKRLDPKTSTVKDDISINHLVGCNDIISPFVKNMINEMYSSCVYPPELKVADVTPIHKDKATTNKKNYRPVSMNILLSKIYERNMYAQIIEFFENLFSIYLFGYRKGHKTQDLMLNMIEMWRKAIDENKIPGAILTDLSKAFDCLSHELLIAKLEAYGFDKSALKLVYDYLRGRKQRTKVGESYSSWRDLLYGVPQGSILGPLLFNIFMNDLFYFIEDGKIANYADDSTYHTIKENIMELLKTLEKETYTVLNWFCFNEMKSNDDKCHLLVANEGTIRYQSHNFIYLRKTFLEGEEQVKLLGIQIDQNLTFDAHLNGVIKKGNQKLHALMRVSKYLSSDQLRLIMKAFIESQFNYCPLLWMFHSKIINAKINGLHERALRVVYGDRKSSFEELLKKDKSFTVHEKNIQKLAVEMYKVKNNISPIPVQDLFVKSLPRTNTRQASDWIIPRVRTEKYGKETIRYRGPLIWDLVPDEIKKSKSLASFRNSISNWKPQGCTCRLCKILIPNFGYVMKHEHSEEDGTLRIC